MSLHSRKVNKKTIKTGNENSARERPNHPVLRALPLFFSKKREIVVEAVWLVNPWPARRIKKIATNKNITEEILENIKHEADKNIITYAANFRIFTSSIFLPIQIKTKLLNKVADAYIEPNCPWEIDKASLILELNKPKKKLCPKLEKNVKIKPNIITFKLKLLNIKNYEL